MLTVEVIEDDIAMRTLLSEWLSDEGHRVRARAGVGTSARGDVDLVVVDLPDLPTRGAGTVRRVKLLHPGAAVIGLSTQLRHALAGDSRPARALGVDRLVAKPSTRGELLAAVADAAGARAGAGAVR